MPTASTTLQSRAQLNPTAQCLPTDLHNDLEQPTCQRETCHRLRVSSHRVTNSASVSPQECNAYPITSRAGYERGERSRNRL